MRVCEYDSVDSRKKKILRPFLAPLPRVGKKILSDPKFQENRDFSSLRCGNSFLTIVSGLERLGACLGTLVGMAHPLFHFPSRGGEV